MKITRRTLAASAVGAAAALGQRASAQSTAPGPAAPAQNAPAPGSETDEQLLQAARDQIKRAGDALTRQKIPMAAEPAFQFKA